LSFKINNSNYILGDQLRIFLFLILSVGWIDTFLPFLIRKKLQENMNGLNRLFALWVFLFLEIGLVLAQESVDLEMVYKIKSEGIGNSQIEDLSFYLTDYLGPRLSGSTNLRNARKWTADKFEEWGLKNIKIDAYGEFGRGWNVKKSYIAMKSPYYAQVIGYPKAWTDGTKGAIQAEVLLLDVKTAEDLEKFRGKLKGKVVMGVANLQINPAFEAEARRFTDKELLERKQITIGGAVGRYTPEYLAQLRAQRELDQKLNQFLLEEEVGLRLTGTRGILEQSFIPERDLLARTRYPQYQNLKLLQNIMEEFTGC
jgi:carboxypeptidase Q